MNRESNISLYRDLQVLELSKKEGCEFYWLRLSPPAWSAWTPGQFVMIRPGDWSSDPFLPRPMSIADLNGDGLCLFWRVAGRGTEMMSRMREGDSVRVCGPLGHGFVYEEDTPVLMLAGGMGIVPFIGLINHHSRPENLELIFGHRQDLSCYPVSELSHRVLTWYLQDRAPKDLARLEKAIRVKIQGYSEDGVILACGPAPFLQMVNRVSRQWGASVQIALEAPMACGFGACLSCSVSGSQGEVYQACTHGPVFWADQVDTDTL